LEDGIFEACDVRPWQTKGESNYLREKIHNQMIKEGIKIFPNRGFGNDIDSIRMRFKEENLGERNIFQLRNNMCEEWAHN